MARDWTRTIPAAVLAANGLTRGDVAGAGVATTVPQRAPRSHQTASAGRDMGDEAYFAAREPHVGVWLFWWDGVNYVAKRREDGRVVTGATRRELVRMVEDEG